MKKANLKNVTWPDEAVFRYSDNQIKYLNRLLNKYSPYCQGLKKFLIEAKTDPVGCWWEMFLANSMIENGFKLEKAPAKGPDIKISLNSNKTLWIEAVSITGGDTIRTDFIPNGSVPEEPYLLRLTSGIHDKKEKMLGYLKDGVVKVGDFFIIAVNTGKFSFFGGGGPFYPAIAKVAFRIGPYALSWSIQDGKGAGDPKGFHQVRPVIKKKQETEISTNLFSQAEYSLISALMYSSQNFGIEPESSAITTVYNPVATNKLSEDFFGFGRRCFVHENIVKFEKLDNEQWVDAKSGFLTG
jgi:hypothetical protein